MPLQQEEQNSLRERVGLYPPNDKSAVSGALIRWRTESDGEWVFHVSGDDIAGQVLAAGAQVATEVPVNYAFISLRAA